MSGILCLSSHFFLPQKFIFGSVILYLLFPSVAAVRHFSTARSSILSTFNTHGFVINYLIAVVQDSK